MIVVHAQAKINYQLFNTQVPRLIGLGLGEQREQLKIHCSLNEEQVGLQKICKLV
jgi:hypothetical protein